MYISCVEFVNVLTYRENVRVKETKESHICRCTVVKLITGDLEEVNLESQVVYTLCTTHNHCQGSLVKCVMGAIQVNHAVTILSNLAVSTYKWNHPTY